MEDVVLHLVGILGHFFFTLNRIRVLDPQQYPYTHLWAKCTPPPAWGHDRGPFFFFMRPFRRPNYLSFFVADQFQYIDCLVAVRPALHLKVISDRIFATFNRGERGDYRLLDKNMKR